MSITQVPSQPTDAPAAVDARLIKRLRTGDEGAFEAIFKRHYPALLSFCRHMLGNQQEAEDALQQAFIRVHRALLGDSPPHELRPWLYVVARNCCLSAIAARRPTDEHDDQKPSFAGLTEQVRVREDLRELVSDIGKLPEDQRSALLLAELEDLSHEAIATIVGCQVSKVKALVYQARATLMAERDARNASCHQIREQLSVARGGELRRGGLRRHLRLCSGCRDFQTAVNAQRQSLALVLPVLPSPALAAKLLGAGALKAAGSSAASGAAASGGAAGGGGSLVASAPGLTTAATSAGATASATTGAGATGAAAVGGTSVGTSGVIGGAVVKAAVTGAIAIAGAGAVVAHNHLAGKGHKHHIVSRQAASRHKLSSTVPAARGSNPTQDTTVGPPVSTQQSGTPPVLTGATGAAGVTGVTPSTAAGGSTAPQTVLIGTAPEAQHTLLTGQSTSGTATTPGSSPQGSSAPIGVSETGKGTTSAGKSPKTTSPAAPARKLRERRLARELQRRERQARVVERRRRAREARERRERLRQQRLARERERREARERREREAREKREAREHREAEAREKREARERLEQEAREKREARERREREAREKREAASRTQTTPTTVTKTPSISATSASGA